MAREFDSPWKEAWDQYLQALLRILCPRLYAKIDWSVPYQSLDTVLQQIVRESEFGPTVVDKLFRVKALDGNFLYLLIHIEVQAQVDAFFSTRMFRYSCRIWERYNQDVESLAILADDDPNWRPNEYRHGTITTETIFRFESVKLLDWSERIAALENDESPIGLAIVAHLQSHATNRDYDRRREWKFRLIRLLLLRRMEPVEIRKLFRLIDWLLNLPAEIENQFREDVFNWEKEQKMPLIGSYEKLVADEAEGRAKAKILLKALEFRFESEGIRFGEELKKLPLEEWVGKVEDAIWRVASVDELRIVVSST